ncbi:MAG: hypothetical protein U0165_05610 [Polyangiaceae bacterium]
MPNPYCPAGDAELLGTGFEDGGAIVNPGGSGATRWLYTQAPVTGGQEFTRDWPSGTPATLRSIQPSPLMRSSGSPTARS